MIAGDTHIMWLDVDTGEIHDDVVSKLFGSLSHMEFHNKGPVICIPLNGVHHLKTTDWRGWSDIISVERVRNNTWWGIKTSKGKILTCTSDTLIPVYDPDALTKGFHGESKYDVKYVSAEELNVGDHLRVRNIVDAAKFHSIDFDTVIEVFEYPEYNQEFAYNVITRSGFINCNDIYVVNDMKKFGERTPCAIKCPGCKVW